MADTEAPLPTDPGLYHDNDGEEWLLTERGQWFYVGSNAPSSHSSGPRAYGPMVAVPWPAVAAEPEQPADPFADAVYSAGALAADVARIGGCRIEVNLREGDEGRMLSIELVP